ncbi:MAG: YjjG family noncanonical pyrimidine nucleotidase [Clostridia bacterium]|nr:YjjG family noncanonical pyrimidine nucleotidase [Clostridia bacterium]
MSRLKVLLWDIDGTILNFLEAEKVGIRMGFARLGLGVCTDEMLADYSRINRRHWEMLERGEITKPEVLEGRFREFFGKYGIRTDVIAEFNRGYQIDLGETVCFNDDAPNVLRALQPFVRQYGVTNGTKVAQERKIVKSGLDRLLDGVFISEDIGAEKPSRKFFEGVWSKIGRFQPDEVMIVGDSLTSDIRGGNNMGIRTCWYNANHVVNGTGVGFDFEIADLREVPAIVRAIEKD